MIMGLEEALGLVDWREVWEGVKRWAAGESYENGINMYQNKGLMEARQ